MSLLADFTSPYSAFEAFVYDTLIAPAVMRLGNETVAGRLIDAVAPGAAVLEVGCGGGQLAAEALRRRPDLRYSGVDLSARQIARARRRLRAVAGVTLMVGSALALPLADGTFDAVLSVASLKHWPDQAQGLGECVRVLRPGGTLTVIEADRGCRFEDARRLVRGFRVLPPMRPFAMMMFRTMVAGRSIDLDDARALAAGLDLDEPRVERIEGTPGLLIAGRRRTSG